MSEECTPDGATDAASEPLLREMIRFFGEGAGRCSAFGRSLLRLRRAELIAALAMLIEKPELASNPAAVQQRR